MIVRKYFWFLFLGLIKATVVNNSDEVSVENMGNRRAERGVQAIRKKVLNPLKILKDLKSPQHTD